MNGLWKRGFGLAFCLVYLLVMAACASSPTSRGTGETFDDASITAKVKTQLAADDTTKAYQINVDTYRGTVQLSGFVDSQQSVDRATEIAKGVEGVKDVKNNLTVKKEKTQ
jgi:osmotically-inducible protein OsmY